MSKGIYYIYLFFCGITTLFIEETFAQTVIGMGTKDPNPNAVLELVSEGLDQGFLVPRFSTSQRTASGFIGKLSNKDNGLLVFDADEGKFYYWYDGNWQPGTGTGNLGGTSTIWFTGTSTPNNNNGKNGDFLVTDNRIQFFMGVYVNRI